MAVCDSAEQKSRAPYSHPWLAEALSAFDARQRRRQAVFEYTRNPACIFRCHISRTPRELILRDGTRIRPGDRVARLHFWNEQIPHGGGRRHHRLGAPDAARYRAVAARSGALSRRPSDLADIAVIRGHAPSATKSQSGQLARIMAYYGFELIAESEPLPPGERLHRLGENILISLIVLAHNAGALRRDTLTRVRVPIYLSRRVLESEFAAEDEVVLGA